MNTANLQMEGLLLAFAALVGELQRKGVLERAEIEAALGRAERGVSRRTGSISDANADAIRFPIRFLAEAVGVGHDAADFQSVAAAVGRRKDDAS
jgi:hypothetical protein